MAEKNQRSQNKKREPKGKKLEREFADWMKSEMGYTETKLRDFVNGKIAVRPYEVDIHGIKYSSLWDKLKNVGIFLFILAILAYFGEVPEIKNVMERIIFAFNPAWAGSTLLIFSIGGVLLGYYGKKNSEKHAWVECKDLGSNVKRQHVQKLASSIEDLKKLEKNAEWKPDVVIVVSGTDFDVDAINFVREYEFLCFKRKGEGFKQIL